MYELNQLSHLHAMNVNDPLDPNFSVIPDNGIVDPDFSVMPDNGVIDPDFSVMPDNEIIDPDFSVMPDNGIIDPDFSVMPDNGIIDPDFSVMPDNGIINPDFTIPSINYPIIPIPIQNRYPFVRFLHAAPDFANLTVEVGNRTLLANMNLAEVSRYRRFGRGYHRITVMAPNGYVYLQQNVYIGANSTIAISASNDRLRLDVITDPGCNSAFFNNSCLRVCNLAYYSGPVNVTFSNGLMNFTNNRPGVTGSYRRMQAGSYPISVVRSARPFVNLLSTYINLTQGRTYTLYILNWNASSDALKTLLVQDIR